MDFIEACVREPDSVKISNAAATCFVENLAGESLLKRLFPRLGPNTREIYLFWSPPSSPGAAAGAPEETS